MIHDDRLVNLLEVKGQSHFSVPIKRILASLKWRLPGNLLYAVIVEPMLEAGRVVLRSILPAKYQHADG